MPAPPRLSRWLDFFVPPPCFTGSARRVQHGPSGGRAVLCVLPPGGGPGLRELFQDVSVGRSF